MVCLRASNGQSKRYKQEWKKKNKNDMFIVEKVFEIGVREKGEALHISRFEEAQAKIC